MAKILTILPSGSSGISLTNISAIQPVLYNSNTGVISSNKSSLTEDGYLSKIDWNTFNSKQDKLNGTGFVKASGGTIIYDDSVYLTENDLPSNLDLYATTFPDPVISGYTALVRNITDERYNTTAVNVPTPVINGTLASPTFCGAVITDPSILLGNPGVFNFSLIGNIRRVGGSTSSGANFFFTIYKRNLAGVETKIADSAKVPIPADGGTYIEYISIALWNDGIFLNTDRVVLKFYGIKTGGGSGATYEFLFGGANPVRGTASISSAIIPNIYLKDLSDVEKVPALDKEILYWNDANSLWEHSLAENLVPSASTTQKGLISTGNQIFAGVKTFNEDLIVNGTITAVSASTANQVVIKSQLDAKANDENVIHTTGDETKNGSLTVNDTGNGVGVKGISVNGSGLYGESENAPAGYFISNNAPAIYAFSQNSQGIVSLSNTGTGVQGISETNFGIYGQSNSNTGVSGNSVSGLAGVFNTGSGTKIVSFVANFIEQAYILATGLFKANKILVNTVVDNGIDALQVEGSANLTADIRVNDLTVGKGNGNNPYNTAIGVYSLVNNTTGFDNTAIGYQALYSNTTGGKNVAIGLNSLSSNTTGDQNIAIGHAANTLNDTDSNSIVIGAGSLGLGSNTTVIGTPETTVTGLYGNIRLVSGMTTAPASATAPGTLGDIRVTAEFIYVCIATNTWVRTELTSW